ncbi:MAG: FGGY family carbohydrate kinase [Sphaerochaetaceae bacterium]
MAEYLFGLDIGTQGVKGALFTTKGELVGEHFIPSKLEHPTPSAITEDPEYQFRSVLEVIKNCVAQAKAQGISSVASKVVAIAIDGQMAGILGVGKDGEAVTPYDSWLDSRCAPYLKEMREKAYDEILQKAGTAPSINHGPKKLWWKNEHPTIFSKIVKFTQPGSYAAARLCGLKGGESFIDRTYLHFSGFSDTAAGKWDEELCKTFGMPLDKLPTIVDSTQIVGYLTKKAAQACDLMEGIPVAAGCGDTVASFLSSGAVEQGMSVDVSGTASVFACTQKSFVPDVKSGILGCCASVDPNVWYSYAYINGGGMNPEWFVENFSQEEHSKRFAKLEKEISDIKDSYDLPLLIPHFAGRVMPSRPHLRGTFAGLQWKHTKAHMFRAILEGVALEYGIYKKAAVALQPNLQIKEVRITGGGAKSIVWNVIKSGVLQAPVVGIKKNQGAPLGVAMIGSVAVGRHSNVAQVAQEWITTDKEYSCDPERYPFFEYRQAAYAELLETMERFTEKYPFESFA